MPVPDAEEDEDERTLGEKLADIETDTINGKKVRATVTETEELPDNKGIRVHARLPSGRTVNKRFEMPESNSEHYEFVRFLRKYGYTLGELEDFENGEYEELEDETKIDIEMGENGPTFIIPDEPEEKPTYENRVEFLLSEIEPRKYLPLAPQVAGALFFGGLLEYLLANPQSVTQTLLTPYGIGGAEVPQPTMAMQMTTVILLSLPLVVLVLSFLHSILATLLTIDHD